MSYPSGFAWTPRSSYAAILAWNQVNNGYVYQDSQLFQAGVDNFRPLNSSVVAFRKDFAESRNPSDTPVFGHTGGTGPYLCANTVGPLSGGWQYSFFSPDISHAGILPFGWLDGHVTLISCDQLRADFVAGGGNNTPGVLTPSSVTLTAIYGRYGPSPVYGYGTTGYQFMPW